MKPLFTTKRPVLAELFTLFRRASRDDGRLARWLQRIAVLTNTHSSAGAPVRVDFVSTASTQ
jgi:hypothetical protein